MKAIYSTLLMVILIFSSLNFQACQPKDGEPGPAGPAGPAGPQGAKGDPGSANVQYSPWISVSFSGSGSSYTGSITAPAITQAVLDRADIRVYWSEGGRVITLPYAQVTGGTTYTVHQRFFVGRIDLLSSYSLGAQQMRYVIIPGGTAVGGRKASVDLSDYQAVKAYYHLPD